MTRTCSAPGCRSGYRRTSDGAAAVPRLGFYSLPGDEHLRKKWIQAMLRVQYKPSNQSMLCELHFLEEDFREGRLDSNESRRKSVGVLRRKLLKPGTVPSQWPGLNEYLSSKLPRQIGKCASTSGRKRKRTVLLEKQIKDVMSEDVVSDVPSVMEKLEDYEFPSGVQCREEENGTLQFFSLAVDVDGRMCVGFSLMLEHDLRFRGFANGLPVPVENAGTEHLTSGGRIRTMSDLVKVVACLNSLAPKDQSFLGLESDGKF